MKPLIFCTAVKSSHSVWVSSFSHLGNNTFCPGDAIKSPPPQDSTLLPNTILKSWNFGDSQEISKGVRSSSRALTAAEAGIYQMGSLASTGQYWLSCLPFSQIMFLSLTNLRLNVWFLRKIIFCAKLLCSWALNDRVIQLCLLVICENLFLSSSRLLQWYSLVKWWLCANGRQT